MKQVNTKFYADQIAEKYPDIDAASIHQLCLFVGRQLYSNVVGLRYDVAIKDSNRNFKVKIYKRDYDIKRANKRARRKAQLLKKRRSRWAGVETKKVIFK